VRLPLGFGCLALAGAILLLTGFPPTLVERAEGRDSHSPLLCAGRPATMAGTEGDDTITGTRYADVIVALDGNDVVDGGGGNDTICGGDGDDRLDGGRGDDTVDSGAGFDTCLSAERGERCSAAPRFAHGDAVTRDALASYAAALALAERYVRTAMHVAVDGYTVSFEGSSPLGRPAEAWDDTISVFTSGEGWSNGAPYFRVKTIAHEYFHLVQYGLARGSDNVISAPLWLLEGSAELVGYGAVAADELYSFSAARSAMRNGAVSLRQTLDDCSAESGCAYFLGFLATDRLVTPIGLSALVRFFTVLGNGTDWEDAFSGAFGERVDEFSRRFEASRTR
jgi:Ca2+-binding RTX toxin-like protein